MTTPQRSTTTRVVVVDTQLEDYHCLVQPAREQSVRLTLTTSGSGALRLAPSFADAVWLVSIQLPDMSGLELLEMLMSLNSSYRIAVIDNSYQERHERIALQLGAIQYVCKPMNPKWIWAWHGREAQEEMKTGIHGHTGAWPPTTTPTQTH